MVRKIVLLLFVLVQVTWQRTIVVSNKDGENRANCGEGASKPCRTIEYVFQEKVSGNVTILLDNKFRETYWINNTIQVNRNVILKTRYQHHSRPIITTGISFSTFCLFTLNNNLKRYTLTLSDLQFSNLSLARFYADGDIVIKSCSFRNPGTLLKTGKFSKPRISFKVISSNFTGYKEPSVYLLEVTDYQKLHIIIEGCVFNETFGWNIQSPKDVLNTRELNITMLKTHMTDAHCRLSNALNKRTELNVEIMSNTPAVLFLKSCHFINIRIHTSSAVVNCMESSFDGGCYSRNPLLEMNWPNLFREGDVSFWLTKCNFTNSFSGALSIRSCNEGHIVGTRFENNTRELDHMGGAILNIDCQLFVDRSTFVNNSALNNGGTIASSEELQITNTNITGPYDRTSLLGSILYCTSQISLDNVIIDASFSQLSTNPYLIYGGLFSVEYGQQFSFYCPFNSDIKIENRVANIQKSTTQVFVYCLPCPKDQYNLTHGSLFYQATDEMNSLSLSKIQCSSCPTSGICDGHLKTKDNFWGYTSKHHTNVLKFIRCPQYYCCSLYGKKCESINTCNFNRQDTLCGRCIKGYSETFVGNKCIPNAKCQVKLFWGLYVLVFIAFLLAILYLKDVFRWISFRLGIHKEVSNTHEENPEDKHLLAGSIKILFFFYQAEELLRVETSAKNQYQLPVFLHTVVAAVFNFQIPSNINTLCSSIGSSIVEREVIQVGIVALVFVTLLCVHTVHLLLRKLRCIKDNQKFGHGFKKSFGARIKCAFIQLMLLGFANLAIFSFQMIHCVHINDKNHLYLQGDVLCYTYWQKIIIAFIVVWIVPFPFVLYLNAYLLREMKISTNKFLKTLFFPPFLIVCGFNAYFRKYKPTRDEEKSASFFLRNIYEPYRSVSSDRDNEEGNPLLNDDQNDENGNSQISAEEEAPVKRIRYYLLGESVLVFRRLALTIVNIVTIHPVIRLYVLFLLMVVFLLAHLRMKPFVDPVLNALETFSLSTLCSLTAINIFWAYTDEFNTLQNAELFTTGAVFVGLELILLALPVIVLCLCAFIFFLRYHFCKTCIYKVD